MKGSNATSARAKTAPRTGRSSVRRRSTLTAEGFALTGPSDPPDPEFHAFRKDLADIALAGRVIASHYVSPVLRNIRINAILRSSPANDGDAICELQPGEPFALIDDSLGWAWGYAGETRRVGYVRPEVLS